MKKSYWAILAVLASLAIASCSDKKNVDQGELSRQSFEAWMSLHAPQAVKQPSGIYVEVIRESQVENAKTPADLEWVRINYTGRALGTGNVFVTRDSEVAQKEGTFSYFTHYEPQYFELRPQTALIMEGQYAALSTMKEGDIWRIYYPTTMAFGPNVSDYNAGYEGQVDLPAYSPVTMDIELLNVVRNPVDYEVGLVRDVAIDQWGLSITDTVRKNFYLKKVDKWGDGPKVNADSMAGFFYVLREFDGFVVGTNIEDTARMHHIIPETVEAGSYAINDMRFSEDSFINAVKEAVKAMDYGETAVAVFTSDYAYGSTGNQNGNTIVQGYTPLYMELFVRPLGGNGTKMFPYYPSGVKKITAPVYGVWVTGMIAGVGLPGPNGQPAIDNPTFTGYYNGFDGAKTNFLLSDDGSSTSLVPGKVIPVDLPDGGWLQEAWNLVDHIDLRGTNVLMYGDIEFVHGAYGVTNVTKIVSQ